MITTASKLTKGQRLTFGEDIYTIATVERLEERNQRVAYMVKVVFQEAHPRTGKPYKSMFTPDQIVVVTNDMEPEPAPTPNPYVEKYGGAPDDPTFVGQVIDSGGEFQFFPDGTLALSEFTGNTYRVVQRLHHEGRDVIVSRRDGSTTPIPEERFTTTDRDLSTLRLRVVYVPEV